MNEFGLMNIKEFANLIQIPESTIRTWKRRNEIPNSCFKKIGGRLFIKVKEMKAFLAA